MIIKSENMILDLLVQTDPKGIVELESKAGIVPSLAVWIRRLQMPPMSVTCPQGIC